MMAKGKGVDSESAGFEEQLAREWKYHKRKIFVYIALRVIVVGVLILSAIDGQWYNVFLCALTLVLFLIPMIAEHAFKIDLPSVLEIIVVLFIFAAQMLGEISDYYVRFAGWDVMLHVCNGFIAAAIGMALVDLMNEMENVDFKLSPPYIALMAFCFSMTVGVLWEFFEFFMDSFFGTDMQKDTWIDGFNSVALNPDGVNTPVPANIDSLVINGMERDQYLDIGLIDTMKDLMVNFVGAAVFCILGLRFLTGKSNGTFIRNFIPVKAKHAEDMSASSGDRFAETRPTGRSKREQRKKEKREREQREQEPRAKASHGEDNREGEGHPDGQ